ncbi:MAG: hypothetical protein ACXAD7_24400 [Candidatus Kariarchaeaceae archaeon]|jgi:hypothetical protein
MSIKAIDYENLKEGDLITWYGVHVLKWEDEISPYGIEPTMAFVQDDTQDELITQLLEALEAMHKEFGENFPDDERIAVDLARKAIALVEKEE